MPHTINPISLYALSHNISSSEMYLVTRIKLVWFNLKYLFDIADFALPFKHTKRQSGKHSCMLTAASSVSQFEHGLHVYVYQCFTI